MGFDDVNKALNNKGNPSTKFDNVGDIRSGYLKDVDLQVVTDTDGVVQYQKDGKTPKEQLVITWQTDERDPTRDDDTGLRKLYCSWRLEAAIRSAFRAAGAQGLEPDAFLVIERTEDEDVQVPNSKMKVKAKTYQVNEYRRPAFGASKEPTEAAAKAEKSSKPSSEAETLAKNLIDSGVTDVNVIMQATGLTKAQVEDLPF